MDMSNIQRKEVEEVLTKARAASAPGPYGVTFQLHMEAYCLKNVGKWVYSRLLD
jgi:hypothetical protein